jgi:hypothetical protein
MMPAALYDVVVLGIALCIVLALVLAIMGGDR